MKTRYLEELLSLINNILYLLVLVLACVVYLWLLVFISINYEVIVALLKRIRIKKRIKMWWIILKCTLKGKLYHYCIKFLYNLIVKQGVKSVRVRDAFLRASESYGSLSLKKELDIEFAEDFENDEAEDLSKDEAKVVAKDESKDESIDVVIDVAKDKAKYVAKDEAIDFCLSSWFVELKLLLRKKRLNIDWSINISTYGGCDDEKPSKLLEKFDRDLFDPYIKDRDLFCEWPRTDNRLFVCSIYKHGRWLSMFRCERVCEVWVEWVHKGKKYQVLLIVRVPMGDTRVIEHANTGREFSIESLRLHCQVCIFEYINYFKKWHVRKYIDTLINSKKFKNKVIAYITHKTKEKRIWVDEI